MAKKQLYFNEAERLYVIEQCTLAEIASRLRLAEKTVRTWKDEGNWETKRLAHLKNKQAFHQELFDLVRTLGENIKADLDEKRPVDPGRLYAFTRLLPLVTKVKDYEDGLKKEEGETADKQKVFSTDTMKIIEEALGI